MATPTGSRDGQFPFSLTYASVSVADAAGDDQVITVPTGREGYLDINKCMALCTTTVAADTTDGVINIKKGSTVIGSYTTTDGDAANSMFVFTPASGYESGVNVTAADTITIASTLAVDGTSVAGVFSVTLALYLS